MSLRREGEGKGEGGGWRQEKVEKGERRVEGWVKRTEGARSEGKEERGKWSVEARAREW